MGSLIAATKRGSTVLEEFSYDPWGRRRDANNWNNYEVTEPTLFTRGFTGHEHIGGYGLINMNGRVYDPRLGRFLSPDPYVQAPDFSQSFNRYSYVWNNPLKYTDPDGEWVLIVVGAIWGAWNMGVKAGLAAEQAGGHFWRDGFWKGAIAGAIVGSAGAFTGGAAVNYLNVGGILTGAAVGGITGAAVGGVGGGLSSWAMGGDFWDGAKHGAFIGGISGALSGGFAGYEIAKAKGLNYWWGTEIAGGRNQWSFNNSETLEYRLGRFIESNYSENELRLFYGDPDIKVGTNRNLREFNARNVDGNIRFNDGRTAHGFCTGGVLSGDNLLNTKIRISKNAVRNLDTWGAETLAHELFHAGDMASGFFMRTLKKFGTSTTINILEFRAYQYNFLRTGDMQYLFQQWKHAVFVYP